MQSKSEKKNVKKALLEGKSKSATLKKRTPPRFLHHLSSPAWKKMKDHFDLVRKNVESKRRSDKKTTRSLEEDEEDPIASALTGAAEIFVNPNITYEFRIVQTGNVNTTNTVQLFTSFTWDPSAITEYSTYLKFLFNEVRIRRARLTLLPIGGGNQADSVAFGVCSDLGFTATAPTSWNQVAENPNAKMISSWYMRDTEKFWDVRVPGDYLGKYHRSGSHSQRWLLWRVHVGAARSCHRH